MHDCCGVRFGSSLLLLLVLLLLPLTAAAQLIHIPTESPEQGKAFSEFNHRMAGVFLLAIGAVAIASQASAQLAPLGKIWPWFFILPGLYLAAMSDPEVWPMGTQTWLEAFRTNPEARQHKIFALLLIALGSFEFARARGRLGKLLATWSFPALAVFGAVLLFFHPHSVDAPSGTVGHDMAAMSHDMGAMEHVAGGHVMDETMLKVEKQHFWFSIVGFAIALFKFLYDGKFWQKRYVPFLWPGAMSVLGVLLIFYAE